MLDEFKENMLYQIFLDADDFFQEWDNYLQQRGLQDKPVRYVPRPRLTISEMVTILIFYHYSGYKCFQYYYEDMVQKELSSYFPGLVTYHRFIELLASCFWPAYLFAQYSSLRSKHTGLYFIDSKKLPVCDNRRIHSNRVFKDVAQRGKTSTGWFYGLKLHLVINNLGEIIHFVVTPANVSDNTRKVLDILFKDLKGKCFGDKGYLTRFFDHFYKKGLHLVTKIRKNMKNKVMDISDKLLFRKRAVIESVNDILMTVFDIDHTRHRSPKNALIHLFAGLAAYAYYPEKPAVFIPNALD